MRKQRRYSNKVYKISCNEETDTNFENNNTVLQVNVDNSESTSKYTLEHQNKNNDQEKVCTTVSQNAPPNKKQNLKRSPRKIKTHHQNVKGYI